MFSGSVELASSHAISIPLAQFNGPNAMTQYNGQLVQSPSLRGRSNVLTHRQRLEIISLFENQNVTKAQLGRMFGVTESAIRKTIRRKESLMGKTTPTQKSPRSEKSSAAERQIKSAAEQNNPVVVELQENYPAMKESVKTESNLAN